LRYEDRTRITPLAQLHPGQSTVIVGRVEQADLRYGRRRSLLVSVSDGSARLRLRFFHFSKQQMAGFVPGQWLQGFGEVRPGPQGLEIVHPQYRLIASADDVQLETAFAPVYPTGAGLQQPRLRSLIEQALAVLENEGPPELLPETLRADLGGGDLASALRYLHHPPMDADMRALAEGSHPMQRRLVFEELLAHQLALRQLRARMRQHNAAPLEGNGGLRAQLLKALPFELTAAQQRVVREVEQDLQTAIPMLRLVQGDVGSGKTVVAALAAAQAAEAGAQTAVMAPTELLAEQHLANFTHWLEGLGLRVLRLSGKQKAAEKRAALAACADGSAQVIVGTHALFQEEVDFHRLGLVVIDEQHRFGVQQRLALRDKGPQGGCPHQLVMTATPIPRSLAMTVYGDLDSSIIDELPPGRQPVQTVVLPDDRRADILERVAAACKAGRQAYWVCTVIEESEAVRAEAAEATAARLHQELPGLRVGLVHGRLQAEKKALVMQAFKQGEIDLLVATTVIEVGVDVPNASLMVIDNAERLGLAQLHQLRGRVGRGAQQSHCVLVYQNPLGDLARARLQAMRETHDGFEIARRDLALRGPGELLGTRQSGLANLRVANVVRDADLLPRVQQAADALLSSAPDHAEPIIRRWLGDSDKYADV
ncbi:MAG: ATP-dependent DNA helicase RecG, partial [Nevskiales bacterium]